MKISLRKRIIAFMLSVILLFSGSISGFASELLESDPMAEAAAAVVSEEATEPATEAATEATESSAAIISEEITEATEAATEEVTEAATEAVTEEATEAAAKEETVEETEEEIVEETETETVEETEESEEETEEETEETEEEKDINLQTTVNGTVIKMTGPSSSFPEGTDYSISATELTSAQENDVEVALRKMELENETKVVSYQAFDIKLIVDGVEAQPLGEVKVTFEGGAVEEKIESTENENVEVFHIDEVAQEAQPITNAINDNTVEMTTNHFSTYVITITTQNDITVRVEHYLDADGEEEDNRLFRTKDHKLSFLSKLTEIAVKTEHYTVSKIVKVIAGENEQTQSEVLFDANDSNDVQLDEVLEVNATYKVYYKPTDGKEFGEVQMFDYQVKVESGDEYISINDPRNYSGGSANKWLAVGSYEHDLTNVYLGPGETNNINKWTGSKNVVKGIIKGVDYETGALQMRDGLYEPGLFTTGATIGKKVLDGYSLQFDRTGDTYQLEYVKKGDENVASAGDQFFPLDSLDEPMEEKDGDRKDGHNYYFGMRYNISFTIGDYVGPLEYYFSGDDDLWVVLDAKDGGGQVVVDIGGIHLAAETTVDLWEYLDKDDPEVRNKEHTLTVLYLERGADQSNCNMRFTLPNSKIVGPTINEVTFGLTLKKTVEGLSHDELEKLNEKLTFEIKTVKDETLTDDMSTGTEAPFEGTTIKASNMSWTCDSETCEGKVHTGTYTLTTKDTAVLVHEYVITESDEQFSGYDVVSRVSAGGKEIQGGVSPTIAFGASSISNTVAYTNTYTPQTTEIEVTKLWKDAGNAYGTRPDDISFTLQWKYTDDPTDSTWKDYDSDDAGTEADVFVMNASHAESTNGNVWKYKVSELPEYKAGKAIHYQAVEIIDEDIARHYVSSTSGTTMINQFTVQIVKVSSSSNEQSSMIPLKDAEFTLSKADGTTYYGKSNGEGLIVWYSDDQFVNAVSVLADGTYTFSERKAPVGYAKSNESWSIEVIDGVMKLPEGEINKENVVGKVYTAYFENTPLYALPSSGGFGIYWYMIAGMFLMMAATVITYKNRREEVLERINRR